MTDALHNHVTRDIKREGACPGCDQLWATLPRVPSPPPNEDVNEWGVKVADWAVLRPGRCLICDDPDNHGGAYCPTGITRAQAEWVRHRREVGLGPRAAS
jgi:hypothetical protein